MIVAARMQWAKILRFFMLEINQASFQVCIIDILIDLCVQLFRNDHRQGKRMQNLFYCKLPMSFCILKLNGFTHERKFGCFTTDLRCDTISYSTYPRGNITLVFLQEMSELWIIMAPFFLKIIHKYWFSLIFYYIKTRNKRHDKKTINPKKIIKKILNSQVLFYIAFEAITCSSTTMSNRQ